MHGLRNVLAALAMGCAVLSPSIGLAQTAGPTPTPIPTSDPAPAADRDADHPTIKAPAECLAAMGNWSEPERWAWSRICAREQVNFDIRYTTPARGGDFAQLAGDPRRLISAAFVRQIFEDSRLAAFAKDTFVVFVDAYIPSIDIGDATIGSFGLTHSKVGADMTLARVTVTRTLRIANCEIGTLALQRVQGGNIEINQAQIDSVAMTQLDLTRLSFLGVSVDDLQVVISHFSDQLSILRGSYRQKIVLSEIKSDGLFVRPASASSIRIETYVDTGTFFLDVGSWTSDGDLTISTVTTGRFFLRRKLPGDVTMSGFNFAGADWGRDPMPLLKSLKQYNPAIYKALAESYENAGQSDTATEILIAKANADYASESSFLAKSYLFAIWLLADYGYRPELGLLWILGFVAIAALVFKTGERSMIKGARPRNWLVFAFDAVIPGIQLDSEHAEIGFRGWRQYFLYVLRFLSAVVVVLVVEMVRRSLPSFT
jgi:hypothetical protein